MYIGMYMIVCTCIGRYLYRCMCRLVSEYCWYKGYKLSVKIPDVPKKYTNIFERICRHLHLNSATCLLGWWMLMVSTMWGPPVISWFRFAPVTIVINTTNHSYSYWTYLHQLRYRTGASHWLSTTLHSIAIDYLWYSYTIITPFWET